MARTSPRRKRNKRHFAGVALHGCHPGASLGARGPPWPKIAEEAPIGLRIAAPKRRLLDGWIEAALVKQATQAAPFERSPSA